MDQFDQAEAIYEKAKEDYVGGEYKLAIEKLDKAIELCDINGWYYYERGHAKDELKDFKGAEEDFTQAIRLGISWKDDDLTANGYYARGNVRLDLDTKNGACEDWTKAAEMGRENAKEALKEYCE